MLDVNPGDHDRSNFYLQVEGSGSGKQAVWWKDQNYVRDAKECGGCETRGKRGSIGQYPEFSATLIRRERRLLGAVLTEGRYSKDEGNQ
jgi:hypothetical protein